MNFDVLDVRFQRAEEVFWFCDFDVLDVKLPLTSYICEVMFTSKPLCAVYEFRKFLSTSSRHLTLEDAHLADIQLLRTGNKTFTPISVKNGNFHFCASILDPSN